MKLLIYTIFLFSTSSVFPHVIIGGEIDKEQNSNGVLELSITDSHGNNYFCTGSKISDKHLITAAHCFFGSKIKKIGISNRSENPLLKYDSLTFRNIYIHPSYARFKNQDEADLDKSTFTSSDIAVIEVVPSPLFRRINSIHINNDFVGENVALEFWGYGCRKSTNESNFPSLRQKGETVSIGIDGLFEDFGLMSNLYQKYSKSINDFHLLTVGKEKNSLYASLCSGDSGGPILMRGELVGINTYYVFNDFDEKRQTRGVSYLNFHSRISKVKDWLEMVLKK